MKIGHKLFFRVSCILNLYLKSFLVESWCKMRGLSLGRGSHLERPKFSWPHKVKIGKNCRLEEGISYKHDGIWSAGHSIIINDNVFIGAYVEFNVRLRVEIASDCLIASGCKFIDHDHGFLSRADPMRIQHGREAPILLEEDVWLGVNCVILKGVTIGRGAIIAAGSIVTKSIPAYEIWGGVPARKIGIRP